VVKPRRTIYNIETDRFCDRWQLKVVCNLQFLWRLVNFQSNSREICSFVHLLRRRVFVVKLRLRDNESVNEAVRRFRKLVEHAGVKKEMRKREFYEKPSDIRRRDRRRAEMRARRANQPPELEVQ
jgi:small subunit ribosomal protein S21